MYIERRCGFRGSFEKVFALLSRGRFESIGHPTWGFGEASTGGTVQRTETGTRNGMVQIFDQRVTTSRERRWLSLKFSAPVGVTGVFRSSRHFLLASVHEDGISEVKASRRCSVKPTDVEITIGKVSRWRNLSKNSAGYRTILVSMWILSIEGDYAIRFSSKCISSYLLECTVFDTRND